jgi:hypothetical protein
MAVALAGPLSAATLTRGPYLQIGTQTSIVIRWRTDVATNSRIQYGTAPGVLTSTLDVASSVTEHEITLTGLAPNTTYWYSIGSTTETLASGADHFFLTAPTSGKPTRIWVLGDSGTNTTGQRNVRDAYYRFTGSRHTDLWLMLGDNAYNNGTDAEYQTAVFNTYQAMLRKSALFSTRGNHENTDATGSVYYNIFSMPTAGQAGGLQSGTEAYYSFDYGDIHFICLDSYGSSRAAGSTMLTWLANDLAQNTKLWTVAFWHHPPYTKGSHDSDTESNLIDMRQNALPILEAGGVDLILGGHSHSYERSYLIDGHYGLSTTFNETLKKQSGGGRPGVDTGSYKKLSSDPQAPHAGAVYAVAGSSGQASGGFLNHPAMFVSWNNMGSLVMDVDGNTMHVKYLRDSGAIDDYFTMQKVSVGSTVPPAITTTTVPDALVNTPYSASFNATGDQPIVWSQVSGTLPPGMTFHPTGTYYGTATAAGTYNFTVQAANVAPAATQSITHVVVSGAPTAPSGLNASAISTSQINLSWTDNSSNESGFKIERSTDATNFAQINTVGAGITVYSDNGLNASTPYSYRVRAYNVAGDSAYSLTASATTLSGAPAAPSALSAVAASSSQINLTWADNSNNESGFKIERSTDGGANYAEIFTTGANATSYSNTALSPATPYTYRVRAYNLSGNSAYSAAASATTLPNAPVAPDGLTATAASSSQINLSWTDNNSNEDGTRIERSIDGLNFSEIATVGANVTTYSSTGLTAGTPYTYRVRAYNAGGNSPYSGTASATTLDAPPAAPSSLLLTAVSTSRIDLRWTDNSSNEANFMIERSTNNSTWTVLGPVGANVTTYSATGLSRNTRYYFRVRAWNSLGYSAYSNTANIKTKSR